MATSEVSKPQHNVFLNDPLRLKSFVGKHVKIKTNALTEHVGWVYTVDPVSESYILVKPSHDHSKIDKVEIIVGYDICDVSILDGIEETANFPTLLDELFHNEDQVTSLSTQELLLKKERTLNWFQTNLIPIEISKDDDQVLLVMNVLRIMPPYRPCDCFADNEVILGKIQGILKSIPSEPIDDPVK